MLLFFDTETTGVPDRRLPRDHEDQPRVVQLGAIMVDPDSRREMMRQDVILYSDVDIPAAAAAVHGITTELSRKIGVNVDSAYATFLDMVEVSDVVIGHNVDFDTDMITYNLRLRKGDATLAPFEGKAVFDTMKAATPILKLPKARGGWKWPSLTECCQNLLGREPLGAHQAIFDVLDTRDVFFALQDRLEEFRARAAS